MVEQLTSVGEYFSTVGMNQALNAKAFSQINTKCDNTIMISDQLLIFASLPTSLLSLNKSAYASLHLN
jgi:hypothetical protein